MDWTIDETSEPGMFLVRCGDVVDSRWHSRGAADGRCAQLSEHRAALLAAAGDGEGEVLGRPFYAVLAVDEWDCADGRYLEHFEWEILPLALFTLDSQEGGEHRGAEASGSIRTIERLSDNRRIFATGFLNATEEGAQTAAQIESQTLRFVSVDPADYECEEEITKIGTDGWPIDGRLRFTNYVIGAATVCATPAIRFAVIWLDGMDAPLELTMPLPDPIERVQVPEIVDVSDGQDIIVIMASAGEAPAPLDVAVGQLAEPEVAPLLASARAERGPACTLTDDCGGPVLPPLEWFGDPGLEGPTPITVDPDGHVYGNFALWNVPHRGFLHYEYSERIFAPRSFTEYAQFRSGRTPVACCADEGCGHERRFVATGPLVLGTTHAGGRLSAAQAAAFYENTGLAVAHVAAGDNEWGPWINGALMPGVDDVRVRELLGAAPSGDWRWIAGQLELVACLMVNSEGFPVRASAFVDQGEVRSLVMGWGASREPDEALVASLAGRPGVIANRYARAETRPGGLLPAERRRLEALERDMALLRPLAAERLAEAISTSL